MKHEGLIPAAEANTDAAPRHGRSPAPFLPRRSEAEIAEAAKKYHGDTEKVPDTDVTSVSCNGVPLESRYGKARELEQMVHMVRAVGHYSVMVSSIYCDSKAQATYQVRLSGGDEAEAYHIGELMSAALQRAFGGYNWLTIECADGSTIDFGCGWVESA